MLFTFLESDRPCRRLLKISGLSKSHKEAEQTHSQERQSEAHPVIRPCRHPDLGERHRQVRGFVPSRWLRLLCLSDKARGIKRLTRDCMTLRSDGLLKQCDSEIYKGASGLNAKAARCLSSSNSVALRPESRYSQCAGGAHPDLRLHATCLLPNLRSRRWLSLAQLAQCFGMFPLIRTVVNRELSTNTY